MFRYIFATLLLVSQSLFCSNVKTLHALIVGGSPMHETRNDWFLRSFYMNDMMRITETLQDVARTSQMEFKPTFLRANHVTEINISRWLLDIPKNSQDTVVVYYAGPGTHASDNTPWPAMVLYNALGKFEHLSPIALTRQINERKPRLCLIFLDCYTKYRQPESGESFIPPVQQRVRKGDTHIDVKRLFADTKGTLVCSSSINGAPAYCETHSGDSGGCFSMALEHWLRHGPEAKSWEAFLTSLEQSSYSILSDVGQNIYYKYSTTEFPVEKDPIKTVPGPKL